MRLAPKTFWAMSLAEWRAASSRPRGQKPLARAELEALMKEHPDA
jgi:uncharacterized phage protein (TIGR02216 family)